jgi:hypothetical protein
MAVNRLARSERALWALTAIWLASAAAAWLWQPATTTEPRAPAASAPLPSKRSPLATIDAAVAGAIIEGNIFSASRSAPRSRYQPFDPSAEVVPAPAPPVASDAASQADSNGVPRLFGTLVGPQGASALMRLDPAIPDALLYRKGDRAGVYSVEEIHEQSVVLRGPRGRIVLRLIRPEGASL